MLEVRGLDVSLGRTPVLHGVDLDVGTAETVALVGPNGAGKTTLLRALSGLITSSGQVLLDGQDLAGRTAVDRVAAGLVQLPAGRALWAELTVADNLAAACFTLTRDLARSRTSEVLELWPQLRERLDQRAGSLSGGEQQVLALAKAMVLRPRLLMVDELSLGLAPVVVTRLLDQLVALRERGTALLVVEQSAATVAHLAARTLHLSKGVLADA